jgi:hypothetical membrane protein
MWETIFNIAMVVVGVALLMFVAWAVDREDKYDEEQ